MGETLFSERVSPVPFAHVIIVPEKARSRRSSLKAHYLHLKEMAVRSTESAH
jgi:hypothetical protein